MSPPLSPSVEMKTQSRVVGVGCLLYVPACRLSPRRSVRGSPRRSSLLLPVVVVSSSSGHRWPLLACPLPLASVCDTEGGAAVFSLRLLVGVVRLVVSCLAGRAAAGSSPVVLFVLACLAVSYRPPPRSIRQAGRGDAADDPAAWVVLIGSSAAEFRLGLAFPFYPCRRGWRLRCGVCVRTEGMAGSACSLACG